MRLDTSRIRLVLTCALVCLSASPAASAAQHRRASSVWTPRPLLATATMRRVREPVALPGRQAYDPAWAGAVTTLAAYTGVPGGALLGWETGVYACAMVNGPKSDSPDCLMNDGVVYGALGGSFVMTYVVADRFGRRAECDPASSWKRAVVGALLGTAPSLMYAAVDPTVTRRAGFELRTTSATRVAVWSAP